MENKKENNAVVTPVMPLRGLVIFPNSILHFDISRNKSVKALSAAMKSAEQLVFITAQKDPFNNDPKEEDLYKVGVVSKVLQMVRISEDIIRVVVKGMYRAEMTGCRERTGYLMAMSEPCETIKSESDVKNTAFLNVAKDLFDDYIMLNGRIAHGT